MPHQVTVTAKTGPDKQVTALVIPNVNQVDLQLNDKRIFVHTEVAVGDNIKEFELSNTAAITIVNTGGNFAITIT